MSRRVFPAAFFSNSRTYTLAQFGEQEMIHESAWFEMKDQRKPRLATASWVPLFANQITSSLHYPATEHWEEFFGAVAIALPADRGDLIEQIEWMDASQSGHRPTVVDDTYVPASCFVHTESGVEGDYLVLQNRFETGDAEQLLIDPDLILGLRLRREGDAWIAPYEDYIPIIRLKKAPNGRTTFVEMRAEHLKDYLCARGRGLLVSTFRSRREVSESKPEFDLTPTREEGGGHLEGSITEIDADGGEHGSKVAVLTMGRTDVDPDDDVPVMEFPKDGETWSSREEYIREGPKRYLVLGEMWRNEWVAPGKGSPRVRGDQEESMIEFVVNSNGERAKAGALIRPPSRWLWFRPAVIDALLSHRGTELIWYTEDTAGLRLPGGTIIHFGINQTDLVNVLAKDIGRLPILWQRLWSAWNVSPDGKVARELLAAQMESQPAGTTAPEQLLENAINRVDQSFIEKFGERLFRSHSEEAAILRKVHRFAAFDEAGFFRLMKDLTRLCVERLDSAQLKSMTPTADKNLGSLKRLEHVLNESGANGRDVIRPLVGVYELRHFDSHLPPSDVDRSLALLELNTEMSPLIRAKAAIGRVAVCLSEVADSIRC
jgi:hypothetical protein